MGTIGIAIPQSMWSARSEKFYTQVLHGLEDVAIARGHTVLSHVAKGVEDELEVLRHWSARSLVDLVVLKDLQAEDPRPALAASLGMPTLVLGDVRQRKAPRQAGVGVDNAGAMQALVADLHAGGHTEIAHVSGPPRLLHTRLRREAYTAAVDRLGLPALVAAGDYAAASGAEATRALLAGTPRPSVIVYDNDAMAIAGAEVLREAGLAIPADISVVAWDDSPDCQVHQPPIAVIDRSPHRLGEELAVVADAVLAAPGTAVRREQEPARLEPRGTVALRP